MFFKQVYFCKKNTYNKRGDNMNIDYSLIGKRIASRREHLELTQAELAEKVNLTTKYISSIENAYSIPSIQTIMKICMALEVYTNYVLLGAVDKKHITKTDEINRLLGACTAQQLDKVKEYVEFLTSR